MSFFDTISMTHINNLVAVTLFVIGLCDLLFHKNMIKKIVGLNIMDTAVYLLLASQGFIDGRTAPILTNDIVDVNYYINPIPSGLVLTGIVVSVSVTALLLSMTVKMYSKYHTLNLDEIMVLVKKEG